jgi:probable rRNA maturation factor
MNVLEIQNESQSSLIPEKKLFKYWLDAVLKSDNQDSEIVIRIVDKDEIIQFNEQYRNKKGATNILSFPFEVPDGVESQLLGDLLVCASVVEREAWQQNKKLEQHWAHLIIHGILHLLGYNHIDDVEAEEMEALEINILSTIGINNPYQETKNK